MLGVDGGIHGFDSVLREGSIHTWRGSKSERPGLEFFPRGAVGDCE